MDQPSRPPRAASEPAGAPGATRRAAPPGVPAGSLDAAELFRERRQVSIRHQQDTYFLRLTRNGKLILTK